MTKWAAGKGISEELGTIAGLCNCEPEGFDGWPLCNLDLSKCGREQSTSMDSGKRDRGGQRSRGAW